MSKAQRRGHQKCDLILDNDLVKENKVSLNHQEHDGKL